MQTSQRKRKSGFTIVELLIVIVVIGILAAITIVAYNGVQQRARDTIRKQDLAQLSKTLKLYEADNGDFAEAGCGMQSPGYEGSGWLYSDYDGSSSAVSINDCLLNGKYMSQPFKDPSGQVSCTGATCHAYLKASCAGNTWLFANLEQLPQNSSFTDDKCFSIWDTSYGINFALKVN